MFKRMLRQQFKTKIKIFHLIKKILRLESKNNRRCHNNKTKNKMELEKFTSNEVEEIKIGSQEQKVNYMKNQEIITVVVVVQKNSGCLKKKVTSRNIKKKIIKVVIKTTN